MTFKELYLICEKVRYKPGFVLTVSQKEGCFSQYLPSEARMAVLKFSQKVIDAAHLDKTTYIESERVLYPNVFAEWEKKDALSYIKRMIQGMEMHEVDEFLKCDGNWVTDPHPEMPEDEKESA